MKLLSFSINKPKLVVVIMLAITIILLLFIPQIKIDTDPENMLSENEPVRIMHNELKERYNMHDIIVMGVINETHPNGVFNKTSLTKIHELSQYVYSLQEVVNVTDSSNTTKDALSKEEVVSYRGVIKRDVMSPSNIDHIEPIGLGVLKFDWLMPNAPKTEAEALEIKNKLLSNNMFKNTIVSEDGKALCLYIPISSKDISYEISSKLQEKIATYKGDDTFHITGLPVAEDTFGIEMFIQMGITAPIAMLCIFLLMLFFFKKLKLILSPMIVAMVSVICTMGLLIATGNTVHIMSSMIPIFIMPIAVLDSIHILSEFFDKYQEVKDRKRTLELVMKELFRPMLFTSLTSAAGFASLALTPIPPVQIFGIFVAFGILFAWLLTICFIPAYIMLMSKKTLENFGVKEDGESNKLIKVLQSWSRVTRRHSKKILLGSIILFALSIYGISLITINDNPVKWFTKDHPIRKADSELNKHFGGTYMAFLSLTKDKEREKTGTEVKREIQKISDAFFMAKIVDTSYKDKIDSLIQTVNVKADEATVYKNIINNLFDIIDYSETDEEMEIWEELTSEIELNALANTQIFKQPEVLNYISKLETYLIEEGGVGKINSLTQLVKKINKELHEGKGDYYKLPETFSGVGQCIISYQNSHLPERLRHCVDTNFNGLNLWLQLKSGDNKDMEKTIAAVDRFFKNNEPPTSLKYEWFGLTYINVIWQQRMVNGMLKAFLGSFVIVFFMMTFLFRSVKWAFLCMLPLSLTIAIIYGVIGYIGKDYDMPVAVLSSLALGLAIDFSIHFLVRSRAAIEKTGNWKEASVIMFGEPSRAITRNVIVIAIGFLPLLLSNLIPYKTVGILLASILVLSGIITLLLLPALINTLERFFKPKKIN
ncbi:MMPL family transporter [uncultured Lacinutrix sp.]|uniref:efflux RND transporter permease subunit n=1 Tax=uncultured Lacinutrix sp. TaxID=574032 RepID=UPI00261C3E6F|nr:MMPL family transporter [uncultured Lacinutrix sp.]